MEVGPLARMLVAYHAGRPARVKELVDKVPSSLGVGPEALFSTLGHWVHISNGSIVNYQCVAPSTWNAGPRRPHLSCHSQRRARHRHAGLAVAHRPPGLGRRRRYSFAQKRELRLR